MTSPGQPSSPTPKSARSTDPSDAVIATAKDLFYVGIGLSVIAFQKTQVQRRAFEQRLRGGPDQG